MRWAIVFSILAALIAVPAAMHLSDFLKAQQKGAAPTKQVTRVIAIEDAPVALRDSHLPLNEPNDEPPVEIIRPTPGFTYPPDIFLDKREYDLLYETDRNTPASPDPKLLNARLALAGIKLGAPIFMRVFKEEHVLEVWMKKGKKFERFVSYPVCAWSGQLGPKLKEGDFQSPEGFYTVTKGALNPNSRWHLSFNLGFPNLYDKAHERTGSFLMIHGNCVSEGCYAMTDPVISEIWTLINAAFDKGQRRFHVHAYPFRMTAKNMKEHAQNDWAPFWQNLKKGYDLFEKSKVPPIVRVCDKQYSFLAAKAGTLGNTRIVEQCLSKTAAN